MPDRRAGVFQVAAGLEPQEDLATVEKVGKPEEQRNGEGGDDQISGAGGHVRVKKAFHGSAGKPPGQFFKPEPAQKIARQIDGERIHADPYKGLAPQLQFFHVDDPVK